MKRKLKWILPAAGVLTVAAVLLIFGLTMSYLTDTERQDNTITIGNIALQIDEGNYEDQKTVAAGEALPKAPKLINTGTNDEYVFLKISVPKKTVTLLYEEDTTVEGTLYREGTPVGGSTAPASVEIFKMIADGANTAPVIQHDGTTVYFRYHQGSVTTAEPPVSTEGWVYLGKGASPETGYEDYLFGYNKRLLAVNVEGQPKKETLPLFDQIQLKSFIDEQLVTIDNQTKTDSTVEVKVTAYGIQADDLGLSLPEGETILTDAQVESIYGIVQRKQGGS